MELAEDYKAALPDPTFSRSLQASFESNVIGSAILMGADAITARGNTTLVTDGEIEERISRESLDQYLGQFTNVRTQGELDTKVERIRRQLFNKKVGEIGGGQGLVTDLIAGVLDLPTLIPFGAGFKAGMTVKQAVPRFAAAAAVDATLTEGALSQTLNETYEPGMGAVNIAGSVVLGSLLGVGVSKLLRKPDADKLGGGLSRESDDVISGKMDADADALWQRVAKNTEDIAAGRVVEDDPTWRLSRLSERQLDDAAEAMTPDARARFDAIRERYIDEATSGASRSAADVEADDLLRGVLGPPPTQAQIVSKLTASLGEPPTPSQIAIANTLGVEAVTRNMSRLFGSSIPLEMMASRGTVGREFASGFFMLRGNLADGRTSDTTILGARGVISGIQGAAKDTMVSSWRDWSREMAGGRARGALARATSDEASLERFSDLAFRAVAYGDDLAAVDDAALREAMSNPHVQRAAKAYRKFDDELFSREVEAGLIANDAKRGDHVRHLYDQMQMLTKKERFIEAEARHAFDVEMNKATIKAREAREKETADAAKFLEREVERADRNLETATTRADDLAEKASEKWAKSEEARLKRESDAGARKELKKLSARIEADAEEAVLRAEAAADKRFPPLPDGSDPVAVAEQARKRDRNADKRIATALRRRTLKEADEAQVIRDKWQASFDVDMEFVNKEARVRAEKIAKDLRAKAESDYTKMIDNAETQRALSVEQAEAKYGKATGTEAQNEMLKWSRAHAEGVHIAAVHGRRSIIGAQAPGTATGGNVRGGRQARNVYTPTRTLLDEGWLETDLLKVIDRQTREDGMDVVLANKYRRAMTEDERKLLMNSDVGAYWKDGKDPLTVPDLELREMRQRMVDEYGELESKAKTPAEKKSLAAEREQMLTYIDESVEGARGIHSADSITGKLNTAAAVARSVNFALYMGGSVITNTIDAARLVTYSGMGQSMQFFAMRMGEKFRSGEWSDVAKIENREMAQAAGFALNHVNFGRTTMAMGLTDPFAMSTRESGAANFSAFLGRVGGQAFGLNWWNNKTQEIAYSMSQYRLTKAAAGGDISSLPRRDQEWLRYIGIDQARLTAIKNEMTTQGITKIDGTNFSKVNHTKFERSVQDAFISALQKDVTTRITTPDVSSLPRFFSNPVMAAVLQFQSFAMEAAQSVTMRDAQRLQEGDAGAVVQGIFAMMSASLLAYYLAGAARSGVDSMTGRNQGKTELDKRVKAWSETPAQLFYQTFDYSGVMPLLTNVNNLFEGFTGQGLKKVAQSLDGGKKIGSTSTRNTPLTGEARVLNILGPTARTLKEASLLGGDVISGQFTQQTAQNALKLTPFASTFYLRNAMENGVDAMGAALELKKSSKR